MRQCVGFSNALGIIRQNRNLSRVWFKCSASADCFENPLQRTNELSNWTLLSLRAWRTPSSWQDSTKLQSKPTVDEPHIIWMRPHGLRWGTESKRLLSCANDSATLHSQSA